MAWTELTSVDQLSEIKSESQTSPVLIFKHSTTCSISSMALNRMQRNAKHDVPDLKIYYLDLRAHRDVSNMIATTFDVEHESPQVLLIDKGQAVYHRSHGDIDAAAIREYLNSVTS